VPARRQERRDISVRFEGRLVLTFFNGEDEAGIIMVATYPRMAEVRIWEPSSSSRSVAAKRERNLMRGSIMYEFHRNPSSRLSMSNADSSAHLYNLSVHVVEDVRSSYRSCKRLVRSNSAL